jgi:hypothetical protein
VPYLETGEVVRVSFPSLELLGGRLSLGVVGRGRRIDEGLDELPLTQRGSFARDFDCKAAHPAVCCLVFSAFGIWCVPQNVEDALRG